MYELHIAYKNYSSWSLRPWVLMRELGIAFEERLTPFQAATNGSQFRSFSPSGKVPCLVDGETTVWDSLAIVEYLAERHPGVWPEAPAVRAWARCAAAEMHSGFQALRSRCSMNCGLRLRLNVQTDDVRADVERIDELWLDGFARHGGPFLAGAKFCAVDAFFAPVAFRVQTYGLSQSEPATAYVARLLALRGMVEWYQAALHEPWREADHEAEAAAAGSALADFRDPA